MFQSVSVVVENTILHLAFLVIFTFFQKIEKNILKIFFREIFLHAIDKTKYELYNCIQLHNPMEEPQMLTRSDASNLLEFSQYKYSLQDVETPNLYRDIYPYTEVPKIPFNHRRVPISMPKDIWITDTTFRAGQQSRDNC